VCCEDTLFQTTLFRYLFRPRVSSCCSISLSGPERHPTIIRTVAGSSKAVVPNAQITVTRAGAARTATTNSISECVAGGGPEGGRYFRKESGSTDPQPENDFRVEKATQGSQGKKQAHSGGEGTRHV
jgi:hypothetical protein